MPTAKVGFALASVPDGHRLSNAVWLTRALDRLGIVAQVGTERE